MSLGGESPEVPPRPSRVVSIGEFVPGEASTTTPKPGPETSEWLITVIGIVAGVVLIICGHEEIGGAILATVIPGYALSRGRAKGR